MSQDPLYIQMFSLHGLVRAENMELGRDADTGGQVKYVIELCNQLSRRDDVAQVDLFTRLIQDKRVSADYAQPIEAVNEKFRQRHDIGNAFPQGRQLKRYYPQTIEKVLAKRAPFNHFGD